MNGSEKHRNLLTSTSLLGLALIFLLALSAGCGGTGESPQPQPQPEPTVAPPTLSYDFREGAQGWESGFADYPPGEEEFYELEAGLRPLPAGVEPSGQAYYISGSNRSDDLYMFLKRKLGPQEGVRPDTAYRLKYTIVFASNAASGCLGIGGAPGESVTLKAGGSNVEPLPVVEGDIFRMNVDKGQQTEGGPAGSVVGDVANGLPCEEASEAGRPYVSLRKEHTSEFSVASNAAGELWLLVGTDSGFEGVTSLYYQSITVELLPAETI